MKLRHSHRVWLCLTGLGAALFALFLFSFVLGRYDISPLQVLRILLAQVIPMEETWTRSMQAVVLGVRLPRIALACMVGCCLSLAGAAYQSVFQNPMAAPDILGASSGACFGAALAILMGLSRGGVTLLAFAASMLTIALVYAVAAHAKGGRSVSILLSGVMISSFFSAGTSYIKLVADPADQLPEITYWMMGSLSGARGRDVLFALIPMAIGALGLFALRWRINLLTLSEEEASALGVNTGRLRMSVVLCATLLTAASVSVSGMIGWVGLVIPHLSRKLVGNDCRHLLPASMLMGALFLLLVDNVSRNLLATEIPIGILTAFVGAPFFLYLMTRKESQL
ncbi:MAG: iron ABC transporter permease [Clostridia bacterium]|nr:iron ABC transporter permease [Clostridia bacterium]